MEAKKPLRVLFCMGINQNFLMQNLLKQKRFGQHLVKCGMAFMTYLVCMFLGILMMTKAWWVQVRAGLGLLIYLQMFRILRQYMQLVTCLERPWWVKGHTNFGNIAKLKLVLGVN